MGSAWKKETREMYVYVGRLRRSGLTGEALRKAIAAIKGATAASPAKVPREAVKRIGKVLGGGEKAVVGRSRGGAIKVWSLGAYERLKDSCKRAVGERWSGKKAPSPGPRGPYKKRRKQYVHWTQRPENAEKLARIAGNLRRPPVAAP